MDHSTARQLMAVYARLGAVINEADPLMRALPEPERSAHLRALGQLMTDVWIHLQLPIVREHEDLDPDGDRFRRRPSA
jgi:hypothetical protein